MAMQEWQTAGWPAEQENCYCVRAPKVWMAKRAEDGADESVSSDIRRIVGRYFKIADGVYRQEPREEGVNTEELFMYLAAGAGGWFVGTDPNEGDGEDCRVAWVAGDQFPTDHVAVPSWAHIHNSKWDCTDLAVMTASEFYEEIVEKLSGELGNMRANAEALEDQAFADAVEKARAASVADVDTGDTGKGKETKHGGWGQRAAEALITYRNEEWDELDKTMTS